MNTSIKIALIAPQADSIPSDLPYTIDLQPDWEHFTAALADPADLIVWFHTHLDAHHALTHLHNHQYETPVVVVGEDDLRTAVALVKAGAVDYLPLNDLARLPEVVENVLHAHDRLHDSHHLLRTFDHNPMMLVFALRHDGIVLDVHGKALELFNLAPYQIIGSDFREFDFIAPGSREMMQQALTGKRVSALVETENAIWDMLCLPVFTPAGEFIGVHGIATDVTVHALTWEELQRSNTRFNMIFRTIPIAALIVELDSGQVISANNLFMQLTRLGFDQMENQRLADLGIFPDANMLLEAAQQQSLTDFETILQTGGAAQDVLISSRKIDLLGRTCVLLTVRDVTAIRKAQLELQHSEKKFRTIFDDSTDVIMIVDGQTGRIQLVNPAVEFVLGYKPHDLIGQPFTIIFPDKPNGDGDTLLNDLNTYGAVFDSQEFRQASGKHLPMDLTATMIDWEDGRSILVTLRDVSDRMVTLNALREAEQRLRHVITNTPVVLFALDPTGRITFYEGRGTQDFPHAPEEVIGRQILDMVADSPELTEDIQRALRGEAFYRVRERQSGYFETHYNPIKNGQGEVTGVIGISINITERIQAQKITQEAERARMELRRIQELRDLREGFVSMLSHEFKKPLTIIKMSAETLHVYHDRLDSDRREKHLNRINKGIDVIVELVEDIQVISRASSGKLGFHPEPTDVLELARTTLEHLGLDDTTEHELIFQHVLTHNRVIADPKLMRYILNNLLGNAQKYTPTGGRITFIITQQEGMLAIQIGDTGIGIPATEQERIFEAFYRASNASRISGTGLGLALVKYSVEEHGGTVSFTSALGQGTTFDVILPYETP